MEEQDPGRPFRLIEVRGSDRDRGAGGRDAGQQVPQLGATDRVDAGRRLIEDEQARAVEDGRGQGELLAHPTR